MPMAFYNVEAPSRASRTRRSKKSPRRFYLFRGYLFFIIFYFSSRSRPVAVTLRSSGPSIRRGLNILRRATLPLEDVRNGRRERFTVPENVCFLFFLLTVATCRGHATSSPICSSRIEFFAPRDTRWKTFETVDENVSSFARIFAFFSRSRPAAAMLPPVPIYPSCFNTLNAMSVFYT